jgi:hypothetical protein
MLYLNFVPEDGRLWIEIERCSPLVLRYLERLRQNSADSGDFSENLDGYRVVRVLTEHHSPGYRYRGHALVSISWILVWACAVCQMITYLQLDGEPFPKASSTMRPFAWRWSSMSPRNETHVNGFSRT